MKERIAAFIREERKGLMYGFAAGVLLGMLFF